MYIYIIFHVFSNFFKCVTSATKYDKLNCSIPFTIQFHIVQSMPLTLKVTYNARK